MSDFPSKVTFTDKQGKAALTDPNSQLSADEINNLKKSVNDNALFHGVEQDLATLQLKHPNPPKGAFAYIGDGKGYRCFGTGWKPDVAADIEIQFQDLEDMVIAIGSGEGGKSYDTLALAQAVDPKPADGTVFQVNKNTDPDNAGYHQFLSTAPNGTDFLKGFPVEKDEIKLRDSFAQPIYDDRVGIYNIVLKGYNPDKKYYLHRLYNRDTAALIEITDDLGTVVASFEEFGRSTGKTGKEQISLNTKNSSGVTGTCYVDWDMFYEPGSVSVILVDYEINLGEWIGKVVDLSSEFPYAISERNISTKLSISNIEIVNTSGADLIDAEGNFKKIILNRVYNYNHSVTALSHLIDFTDENGTLISRYYENSQPALLSGQTKVLATPQNGSGISISITLDWSLFSGDGTVTFNYLLDEKVAIKGYADAITNQLANPTLTFFDAAKNTWPKRYNAIDKCDTFKAKLLTGDTNIVFVGDSLLAKTDAVSPLTAEELKTSYVWLAAHSSLKRFYELYVDNKPDSFRFDSTLFTETGVFTDGFEIWEDPNIASWSDANRQEGNRSRYSQDANAATSFDWDLSAYEKANFVYDLDYRAAASVTLAVSGGVGLIEVYNGTAWVEADGYNFSQFIDSTVATDASGYGLQVNKVRLKLRRVASTGTQTLTFTKDATADYFFYWGAEFWNGNTIHFHNAARGGKTTTVLQKFNRDIANFNPDLIVFETPLINESFGATTIQEIAEKQQDFIWGDRAGFENSLSLKNLYPNTDVSVIIPHLQSTGWSGDKPVKFEGLDGTPIDLVNKVKSLFTQKNDYGYVDILEGMIEISRLNEWTLSEAFSPSSNTIIPASFFADGAHQNDYGALVWGMILNSNLKTN